MDFSISIDLGRVAQDLQIRRTQVESVVGLLDEGNTVPFITRYRKERTGNLDEEMIRRIQGRVSNLRALAERKATVLRSIEGRGKLTEELSAQIMAADNLARLEDLYLPYKPKKKTLATVARDRGLEPLAEAVWNNDPATADLLAAASAAMNPEKELPTVEEVMLGVQHILAERIAETAAIRDAARRIIWQTGKLSTARAEIPEGQGLQYQDYFAFNESVNHIPPHRILAINRGSKEGALKVQMSLDLDAVREAADHLLPLEGHAHAEFLKNVARDALDRLLLPSLEREVRRELTERAEEHAVSVFSRNLRSLLLQPPIRGRRCLAIDPGFRTGCKLAVIDEIGNLLDQGVIHPHPPQSQRDEAKATLKELVEKHGCSVVAIGNGTACRETEELVSEVIAEGLPDLAYAIVNEAGASVYSTSSIGREEFPEFDATLRGTISIGRRLQDPLSELVKIEPQSIGVGLYQHDVNPKWLKETLDGVVESCVNFVGVDLNTASVSLLRHVSGLNQLTARRLVERRVEKGPFENREQLKEVSGIGEATFTQAAGFLKVPSGTNPLDRTWIHPESYTVATRLLEQQSLSPDILRDRDGLTTLRENFQSLDLAPLAEHLQVGLPTLRDIVDALARPDRDPREDLPAPIFKKGVLRLEDLQPGMELKGTVLNVVDFGAFVDIGLKDSGLVHISQMANRYIRNPHEITAVGNVVTVWVLSVDDTRRRVSLSMVPPGTERPKPERREPGQRPARRNRPPRPAQPQQPLQSQHANGAEAHSAAETSTQTAPAAAPAAAPRRPPQRTGGPPGRGGGGATRPPSRPRRPAPPAKPLSAEAIQGATPLRSFGELKQFWEAKDKE